MSNPCIHVVPGVVDLSELANTAKVTADPNLPRGPYLNKVPFRSNSVIFQVLYFPVNAWTTYCFTVRLPYKINV